MTTKREQPTEHGQSHAGSENKFARLVNDGDAALLAFCGEPFSREVVWVGNHYEAYDPRYHIGMRASPRLMINIYLPGADTMRIMEGGIRWLHALCKIRKEYDLNAWIFEVKRHGEAGDPRAVHTLTPERKISPAEHRAIASLKLHDLSALAGEEDEDEVTPIDEETAVELIARLRLLPREQINMFLKQFKVQRARDLVVADMDVAWRVLGTLEIYARKYAKPAQSVTA